MANSRGYCFCPTLYLSASLTVKGALAHPLWNFLVMSFEMCSEKQNLNFDEGRILPLGSAFSFADLLFTAPQPS
jgi:hypothetical protein